MRVIAPMIMVALVIATFVGASFYLDFLERRRAPRPDHKHISWMEHDLGMVTREKPCSDPFCRACSDATMMTGAWGSEDYEWHSNDLIKLAWDKQIPPTPTAMPGRIMK